jgi:hypothetical protein
VTPLQQQIRRIMRNMRATTPRDVSTFACDIEDALEGALCHCLQNRPWNHIEPHEICSRVKALAFPTVQDTDSAAAHYLAQPGRAPEIDRFLIELLLASEMLAFAWNARATARDAWPNLLLSAAILYGIARWIDTGFWYAVATALLLAIALGQFQDARTSRYRLKLMVGVYHTLQHEAVGVRHLRNLVHKSTVAGVIWPKSLQPLLDDIESRTTHLACF